MSYIAFKMDGSGNITILPRQTHIVLDHSTLAEHYDLIPGQEYEVEWNGSGIPRVFYDGVELEPRSKGKS